MREVTETFRVYTYESAPSEVKEKIRDYIIYNWDLYDHCMEERIDTLKSLAGILNGTLDYSLSCVPSRGEYITIIPKGDAWDLDSLQAIIDSGESCPLTGVCYDEDIIESFKRTKSINQTLNEYINSMHDEYRHMCTDEYIADMCEVNNYEFTADGKVY
jgi:hypothetical protein